jgi:cytochrome c biogenesis protein CcmG/thiol:disulfide interchange protein DsbE
MEQNIPESTVQTTTESRRPHWGRILVWVGVLGLLAILALGLRRAQQGPVTVGDQVPNFALTTFDGETINLTDLKGKVVVLNFWASWCKPCEQEAADLEAAWLAYKPRGDVVFLGVDYVDTEPEARGYLEKFNITYPNGPDLGTRISQAFRIRGVPETYIIDQENVLRSVQIGPFRDLSQIQSMIDPLLQ